VPAERLTEAARSPRWLERLAAALSAATPHSVRARLTRDGNRVVRVAAQTQGGELGKRDQVTAMYGEDASGWVDRAIPFGNGWILPDFGLPPSVLDLTTSLRRIEHEAAQRARGPGFLRSLQYCACGFIDRYRPGRVDASLVQHFFDLAQMVCPDVYPMPPEIWAPPTR
jgi:hypothetical protein